MIEEIITFIILKSPKNNWNRTNTPAAQTPQTPTLPHFYPSPPQLHTRPAASDACISRNLCYTLPYSGQSPLIGVLTGTLMEPGP